MHANRIRGFFDGLDSNQPTTEKIPETALEERQHLLRHHVKLVCREMTNGLFVYGSRGGLGKTRIILGTLRQEGILPLVLNGHITPLSLYTNLYHNAGSTVFLDDCDSLYRNLPALGILRSALWGDADDGRLVTYNSSQIDIPSAFQFTGRIIFTANTLPSKNDAFNAVLSRIDVFELDASNDEVVELMFRLSQKGFESMTTAECNEVVSFIADHASTRDLSLRLLEPSYQKFVYARHAGVDWRELVRTQLDQFCRNETDKLTSKVNDLDCLRQVIQDHASVKEQVEAWCRLTQKSRATFFRLKKSLEAEQDGTTPQN